MKFKKCLFTSVKFFLLVFFKSFSFIHFGIKNESVVKLYAGTIFGTLCSEGTMVFLKNENLIMI